MELDWAQSQPQEALGIGLGRNTKGEDTYKEKTVWLTWKTKLEKR
jgi:hypothetical protein